MPNFEPVTLRTARLTLRWMAQADLHAQFAIFSDPQVARYWSSTAWTGLDQAQTAIDETLEGYRTGKFLRLAVVRNDTGEMIGNVSLFNFYDTNRRCELGYVLGCAHWGQGFANEAVAATLAYGFEQLNLNRVEADIDPRNDASARVLVRQGFRKEGYMRERWIVAGETCDTDYYGLLRREWTGAAADAR